MELVACQGIDGVQSVKAKISIGTEYIGKYCCVCISVFTETRGSSQLCPLHTAAAVIKRCLYIQDLHIEQCDPFLHEYLDLKLIHSFCKTRNKYSAYVGSFQYFKLFLAIEKKWKIPVAFYTLVF
jgi:hypothetical protein